MFVDAHAHLDKYTDDEIRDVIATIEQEQILTLSVSVDTESFVRAESIAQLSRFVTPAFGVQPSEAPRFVDALDGLQAFVDRSRIIGEIGLDYRFVTDNSLYPAQRRVFGWFLEQAAAQDKIVSVHCAGAERDVLRMIVGYGVDRAIVHWYSGPFDVLDEMISAHFYFSIGVEVLHSDHIRRIAARIPDEQLLTETDNPGGQHWVTGTWGYPEVLRDIVCEIAAVRGVANTDIETLVAHNFVRITDQDAS